MSATVGGVEIPTPETDKMLSVKDESQTIGKFLEWLGEQGIELCHHYEHDEDGEEDDRGNYSCYDPLTESIEKMLARYFEIDLQKVDQEKRAILEALQAAHS